MDRAREWLGRYGLAGLEVTPLLMAKLEARQRTWRATIVVLTVLAIAFTSWSVIDRRSRPAVGPNSTDIRNLVWVVASYLTVVGAIAWGTWHRHRLERPLLSSMTTRTAHPIAATPIRVLGPWVVTATVWVYGGGVLLGWQSRRSRRRQMTGRLGWHSWSALPSWPGLAASPS